MPTQLASPTVTLTATPLPLPTASPAPILEPATVTEGQEYRRANIDMPWSNVIGLLLLAMPLEVTQCRGGQIDDSGLMRFGSRDDDLVCD